MTINIKGCAAHALLLEAEGGDTDNKVLPDTLPCCPLPEIHISLLPFTSDPHF